MSCPEFQLVFAALAQRDIDDILAYTIENWGAAQLEKYKRILDIAFKKLEQNPNIGQTGFPPDFRSFQAGSHVIFYRIDETSIHVIRILHGRMDFSRHLSEE
jgi:toxin ParE1/3/4